MNGIHVDVQPVVESQSIESHETDTPVPPKASQRSIPQWVEFARLREPSSDSVSDEDGSEASSASMSLWFSSLPVTRWSLRLL